MAQKLRREKDILKRNASSYINATSNDYTKYLEGSPVFITYYQLNTAAQTHDVGLEAANDLVGANTPKKYNKINDTVIYGVDTMDILSELTDRGFESEVHGEFIIIPDTVRPYPDDFFVFDYDGMEKHLFRITDVQFDKASPEKYFRCSYELYPHNADDIFNNVTEDFDLIYENIGSGKNSIIKSSQAATQDSAKIIVDEMLKTYVQGYYDEENDQFVYYDGKDHYWNPYNQHFLHETGIINKYHKELLTEIYVTDINEVSNPEFYKEWSYRKSIYYAVKTKNKIDIPMTFIKVSDGSQIKQRRNLPYFMSAFDFKLITPIEYVANQNLADCTDGWNYLLDPRLENDKMRFSYGGHSNKVHKLDEAHLALIEENIHDGDMVYECLNNEIEATQIVQAHDKNGSLELQDAQMTGIINNVDGYYKSDLFLQIIDKYLKGTLELTEDLLKELNTFYYDLSVKNYVLMPIVIFILKDLIG